MREPAKDLEKVKNTSTQVVIVWHTSQTVLGRPTFQIAGLSEFWVMSSLGSSR